MNTLNSRRKSTLPIVSSWSRTLISHVSSLSLQQHCCLIKERNAWLISNIVALKLQIESWPSHHSQALLGFLHATLSIILRVKLNCNWQLFNYFCHNCNSRVELFAFDEINIQEVICLDRSGDNSKDFLSRDYEYARGLINSSEQNCN